MLVVAGAGAGAMNALAGGGTLLTFPALIVAGLPAKIANATSTVALVPGAFASFLGYREEATSQTRWLRTLLLPSLLGGAAGSLLLLATPEKLFASLAPALVLFATLLFALQGRLASRRAIRDAESGEPVESEAPSSSGAARLGAAAAQTGVAIYGGYFGAGIGILMLALLGALGLRNIHGMNGLKNLLGIAINGVATAIFVASGSVDWPTAGLVLVGSVPGGFGGARLGQRVGQARTRQLVVLIGLASAALLLLQKI